MKKILYTLAAAAILLTACNKDEGTPEASDNVPVQFSTAITKAAGATWGNTDEIGVFMVNTTTLLTTARLADNVKLTTNGTDFTLASPIYYPTGSQAVDFVAYYPYRVTPESTPYIYKVNVSDQNVPANIDLLYSKDAQNKTRSTSAVGLTFVHKLSKVVLNIKTGTGVTNLTNLKVKITGMPTKADFKLATGEFETPTDAADLSPNKLDATTETYGATYEAIVIPHKASEWSGRKLVFTIGSDVYEYAIANTDDFVSGKSHTYNITIKKSGITVSRGNITDWTGTGSIAGDLGEGIPQEITKNGIKMVYIPKGRFMMGSRVEEDGHKSDETHHIVTLTKNFYMSKYQITNAQYAAFLNAKGVQGETLRHPAGYGNMIGGKCTWDENNNQHLVYEGRNGEQWGIKWDGTNKWISQPTLNNHPVIWVTWYGATEYAKWIGGRLPTEAQWEYACKAGTTSAYSFGANAMGDYAWYESNSSGKTHEVGTKTPNAWGLYDMHGNVWEWCSDLYAVNFGSVNAADPVTDPTGPETGRDRVVRGGSWSNYAQGCRSAFRPPYQPHAAFNDFGIRVVFVP